MNTENVNRSAAGSYTSKIADTLPVNYLPILDKGYVGLVDVMGTDKKIVNAARTSFAKNADEFTDERNEGLVNYLLRKKEYATLRHNALTFEMRMPLMIARQLWKYIVASNFTEDQLGWNENSRRYITEDNEFYLPGWDEWRTAPENKKQGSAEPLPSGQGSIWEDALADHQLEGDRLYREAMEAGIAPELARLFLPAYGLYVTCYWTTSLNAVLHVLTERLEHDAQKEIQDYAKAIAYFVEQSFPIAYKAWKAEN